MGERATPLTFQRVIDSETARLIAQYLGIARIELNHLLVCASVRTLLHGGTGHIALLLSAGAALMQLLFAASVPSLEARLLRLSYPLPRAAITLGLGMSAKRAVAATERIRARFDATDRRIGDGRRYLAGDWLTLADIARCVSP